MCLHTLFLPATAHFMFFKTFFASRTAHLPVKPVAPKITTSNSRSIVIYLMFYKRKLYFVCVVYFTKLINLTKLKSPSFEFDCLIFDIQNAIQINVRMRNTIVMNDDSTEKTFFLVLLFFVLAF